MSTEEGTTSNVIGVACTYIAKPTCTYSRKTHTGIHALEQAYMYVHDKKLQ